MSPSTPPAPVRRRHVFYLAGFDPRGPAYYRRLYAEQAALQARAGGPVLQVGERERVVGPTGPGAQLTADAWDVEAVDDTHTTADPRTRTRTRYEFLRWDDVVRRHWPKSLAVLLFRYLQTLLACVPSGALWRMVGLGKGPLIAGLAPLVALLLVLAAGAGAAVGAHGWALSAGWPVAGAALAALAAFVLPLLAGGLAERRLNASWLLRIYAFTLQQGRGTAHGLDERINAFAQRVAEQVRRGEDDEVLIVGHSVGVSMAVSVLARARRLLPTLGEQGPRVGLLTLGQCLPILNLVPEAQAFRAELAEVAELADAAATPSVTWIDFAAASDGACFAAAGPLAGSGVAGVGQAGVERPKRLSPRFHTLFSMARYAAMRRDWYRHHFQYLMAGERPGDYDYFAITAGPLSLAERFGAPAVPAGSRSVARVVTPAVHPGASGASAASGPVAEPLHPCPASVPPTPSR